MIKVTCELKEYSNPSKPSILIHSHWYDHRFIEIEINGERYIIFGEDMIKAVNNATNTGY